MNSKSGAIGGFIIGLVVTAVLLFMLIQIALLLNMQWAGSFLSAPWNIIYWLIGLGGGLLVARWGAKVGLWRVISFWFNQDKNLPRNISNLANYYKQVAAEARSSSNANTPATGTPTANAGQENHIANSPQEPTNRLE